MSAGWVQAWRVAVIPSVAELFMANSEEGRMALHCGHRELRQRREGFLRSSCFSGFGHRTWGDPSFIDWSMKEFWISVASCFKMEHSQCRIIVLSGSFSLSPLGGELNSHCCQNLNSTLQGYIALI